MTHKIFIQSITHNWSLQYCLQSFIIEFTKAHTSFTKISI